VRLITVVAFYPGTLNDYMQHLPVSMDMMHSDNVFKLSLSHISGQVFSDLYEKTQESSRVNTPVAAVFQ